MLGLAGFLLVARHCSHGREHRGVQQESPEEKRQEDEDGHKRNMWQLQSLGGDRILAERTRNRAAQTDQDAGGYSPDHELEKRNRARSRDFAEHELKRS